MNKDRQITCMRHAELAIDTYPEIDPTRPATVPDRSSQPLEIGPVRQLLDHRTESFVFDNLRTRSLAPTKHNML